VKLRRKPHVLQVRRWFLSLAILRSSMGKNTAPPLE
jgi:hypothetical protein